jgi:hypothetical protein
MSYLYAGRTILSAILLAFPVQKIIRICLQLPTLCVKEKAELFWYTVYITLFLYYTIHCYFAFTLILL